MPALTARFAIAALAGAVVAAVVPGSVVVRLLVVNGALVVAGAVDWLLAPRAGGFAIERRLPKVITLGGSEDLRWRVRSHRTRPFRIDVADELAPSLRAGDRRFHGVVPPRGVFEATTTLTPARRGRFEVTELVWRTHGPLGLAARQGRTRMSSVLRVYPRFRSREEAELKIDKARILEVGLRSAKGRGGGTEFDQLREYTSDDEFRRIDWSATARAGRPIVRTYRAERNQNVVVLFDNGRVMAGRVATEGTAGVPRAEYAMDAALLITTVATRLGDRCGLLAFDRGTRAAVAPGHGRGQLGKVTEALYDLEPALVDSDYAGAFHETLARFRRRALIVLLTDLVEQAVGESLLPAVPVLTKSHVLLVGAIQDPRVRAWADGEGDGGPMPGSAEAPAPAPAGSRSVRGDRSEMVYRQAAAARTMRSRARAAARLRAAGATVVDVPPALLASTLGDAYLDMKASGRL